MLTLWRTLHLFLATLIPMLLGLGWGLLVAVLTLSRRRGLNQMIGLLAFIGPAIACTPIRYVGVREPVTGPAVYIFNHQSGLDPIILCHVIRRDVAAISKSKWRRHPVIGPLLWFGETVFVDERSLSEAANRQALRYETIYEPAIVRLRQGRSLAIAPEGTRSSRDDPGSFRAGAFRIAELAQVPVIPIVIYNAGQRLRARSLQLSPGPIDVEILSPVYPADFSETPRQTADRIRSVYQQKLRHYAEGKVSSSAESRSA